LAAHQFGDLRLIDAEQLRRTMLGELAPFHGLGNAQASCAFSSMSSGFLSRKSANTLPLLVVALLSLLMVRDFVGWPSTRGELIPRA
jgi:hypothetical protein